jgi:hypothetical protein
LDRANLKQVPFAFESARRASGRTLEEVLKHDGPLALDVCLRYATDLATELREMHLDGRAHGNVDPAHVAVRSSGASLLQGERRGLPDPLLDLTGFGSVLYAMLTGKAPSGDEFRLVPAKPSTVKGAAALRSSAKRLAERCFTAERETAPDLQKILTEVRLLNVMAKQYSSDQLSLHIPSAPPSVSYPPPQPLAVFAGKAPPIINPPTMIPGKDLTARPEEVRVPMDKPGDKAPQTLRAKGSHSRPVLQDVMCPKCKGYHVRLSRPRTRVERFLNMLGMGVHRCHRCFYRYIPFFGRKIVRKIR